MWSPKSHIRLSMHTHPSTQPLHQGKPTAIPCDLIQSTACNSVSPSWSDEGLRTMSSPEIMHPVHPHRQEAWLVYLTIGNISKDVHCQPSQHAWDTVRSYQKPVWLVLLWHQVANDPIDSHHKLHVPVHLSWLTCTSHHQSPIHILLNHLSCPASSSKTLWGSYEIAITH